MGDALLYAAAVVWMVVLALMFWTITDPDFMSVVDDE